MPAPSATCSATTSTRAAPSIVAPTASASSPLSIEDLLRIDTVVAVVSEAEKPLAILGVLRAGVIDVLIVDEGNARAVLELGRATPAGRCPPLDRPARDRAQSRQPAGGRPMPVVPTQQIVQRAFTERYGVAAINVVNDLTMEAVLAAAEGLRAPLIVQTSVKTVKAIGADVLFAMWTEMTRDLTVPVALHLDHCPNATSSACASRRAGTRCSSTARTCRSTRNTRQTIDVVAEAARYGRSSRARSRASKRVEEMADNEQVDEQALETAVDFVRSTGVDIFAPAIGTPTACTRPPQRSTASGSPTLSRQPESPSRCTVVRA
jgi:hypothetical protein